MQSKFVLIATGTFLFAFAGGGNVYASTPAGGCSLLTPAQIQKVTGYSVGAPTAAEATPAFANQPPGSQCTYRSQNGSHEEVDFIVYADRSREEANQTFQKLSAWYVPKSKPAVGDSAYIDKNGAIHVLKGNTRFFIEIHPQNEKQLSDLAASVAAQL